MEQCLSTSRGESHEENFGGPKLGPKSDFWELSQVCIISFSRYCAGLELGPILNI